VIAAGGLWIMHSILKRGPKEPAVLLHGHRLGREWRKRDLLG
jgi:hypothetical protein